MSSRDSDSYSGSSRSRSRDHDSRPHRNKSKPEERQRSRSRERRDYYNKLSRNRSPLPERERKDEGPGRAHDETPPPPPPPPRISKITMGFSKPLSAPIKMSLGGSFNSTGANPVVGNKVPTSKNVAAVFNTSDDEDEPEEMPAEARMRMRNIGRETPTSAGPNSFGKTKQGFCDAKNVFEKSMKQAMDAAGGSSAKKQQPKFPQTIYKINNSL